MTGIFWVTLPFFGWQGTNRCMRRLALIASLFVPLALGGCALPDWMVPRLWKPVSSSDASRQAQQERYDRKYGPNGTMPRGNNTGVSDGIYGASARPPVSSFSR